MPQGYLTLIDDGRSYGEALLDPSKIYVDFVAECQRQQLSLRYAVHVTGHGWRKLMRLNQPFVYRMTDLGTPQPVFATIAKAAGLDQREMYATFNMGVGFAVFVREIDAEKCVAIAKDAGHVSWIGGRVASEENRKAVQLLPIDITFAAETLQLR